MVGVLGKSDCVLSRRSLFSIFAIENSYCCFMVVDPDFFDMNTRGEGVPAREKTHKMKAVPASLDSSWPKANWKCFHLFDVPNLRLLAR